MMCFEATKEIMNCYSTWAKAKEEVVSEILSSMTTDNKELLFNELLKDEKINRDIILQNSSESLTHFRLMDMGTIFLRRLLMDTSHDSQEEKEEITIDRITYVDNILHDCKISVWDIYCHDQFKELFCDISLPECMEGIFEDKEKLIFQGINKKDCMLKILHATKDHGNLTWYTGCDRTAE